jgi:hypothetical protein
MRNDIPARVFFRTVPLPVAAAFDDAPMQFRTPLRIWMLRQMPLKGYGGSQRPRETAPAIYGNRIEAQPSGHGV